MTLDEIRKSDKLFLLATDIAEVVGSNPHSIRQQAKENPAALGFPVYVVGRNVRIPRIPFLQFLGEEGAI